MATESKQTVKAFDQVTELIDSIGAQLEALNSESPDDLTEIIATQKTLAGLYESESSLTDTKLHNLKSDEKYYREKYFQMREENQRLKKALREIVNAYTTAE